MNKNCQTTIQHKYNKDKFNINNTSQVKFDHCSVRKLCTGQPVYLVAPHRCKKSTVVELLAILNYGTEIELPEGCEFTAGLHQPTTGKLSLLT